MSHQYDHVALADAWIRMQLNETPEAQREFLGNDLDDTDFDLGFELVNLAIERPGEAWPVIRELISRYGLDELQRPDSEAQRVLGMLGAGPLEDLLSYHGEEFIGLVESEARCDAKFRWLLAQVARSTMSEALWNRVQIAAAE